LIVPESEQEETERTEMHILRLLRFLLLLRKAAGADEGLSGPDSGWFVKRQNDDGCPACRANAVEPRAVPSEVLLPKVGSRVKEPSELAGFRVEARNVGPFIEIAAAAAQGKILQRRAPAVLAGDNMVHDVPECGSRLREQAILGTVACAAANFLLKNPVHAPVLRCRASAPQRCLRLGFYDSEKVVNIEIFVELGAFGLAQGSLTGFVRKLLVALVVRWGEVKGKDMAGQFGWQAGSFRFDHTLKNGRVARHGFNMDEAFPSSIPNVMLVP
jgi:hypothetical protein